MNIQEEFGQITQKILDKLEVVCEKNKNKILACKKIKDFLKSKYTIYFLGARQW